MDDDRDADIESGDEGEPSHQCIGNDAIQELEDDNSKDMEFGLIRDQENKKIYQVPIDSEEYRSAAGPSLIPDTNPDSDSDYPLASLAVIRMDEFIESMSGDEWEDAKFRPMEEVMELATSVRCTAYATDAEATMSVDQPSIFSLRSQTHIFIAETKNLKVA